MRSRPTFWIVLCLLLAAGAWFFWRQSHNTTVADTSTKKQNIAAHTKVLVPDSIGTRSTSASPGVLPASMAGTNAAQIAASATKTNKFAYRLTNTKKTIDELVDDPHAILLESALIDTDARLNLSIPKSLQSQGDPEAYIVQANGPIDKAFRAMLADAGAQIVSYIPNNAYLVRVSASGVGALVAKGFPPIPYEPYYKLSLPLLRTVMNDQPVGELKLAAFPGTESAVKPELEKLGTIVAEENSALGEIFTMRNVTDVAAVAQNINVRRVEISYHRALANDLARVTLGVSTNTLTATNYMGLTGKNVIVEVNDTGIDATHPDFTTGGNPTTAGGAPIRVVGDAAQSLVDTNGHGTHVAGIIAGNGAKSFSVPKTPRGSVTNADFRGKAPAVTLYSIGGIVGGSDTNAISDRYFQEVPARTNALISNNSWDYDGDSEYDLAAASYDAAVRDALPTMTGSQPVLFVFAAGNFGSGNDAGGGGNSDTIFSPGTAKNVITVGAVEQLRNITNIVTDANSNSGAVWLPQTDSANQVAGYSSRGNVGIGTEGKFGRFKPDVVAPGSFVVSTRSGQWDTNAYYSPTNYFFESGSGIVSTNFPDEYSVTIPANAVQVIITVTSNSSSPVPFPNFPIYVSLNKVPNPANPATFDFQNITPNQVSIPPNSGGAIAGIQSIQNGGFNFAIADGTNFPASYNVTLEIITTNNLGNYLSVLQGLNETLAPFYRYESGTSMATPAISGLLALMQDYFTNTLQLTPSPVLLKAMLVNGSRAVNSYRFAVTNAINFQGWGLANLTNSLPRGFTNAVNATCSSFFLDQSPTNALATGDRHTFAVTVTNLSATILPLRVTLAWTDPSGDPAAAIKLVNNLDLMVSNAVTGKIYYGNNFLSSGNPPFSIATNPTNTPVLDSINNVENVFIAPLLSSGTYYVTVTGRAVNVNAVTAQSNNVVQDFALVISCGEGEITNAITVTDAGIISNPTGSQDITVVTTTNTPLFNQIVGANTPLLGTNTIPNGGTNEQITLGMTNQWHFYIITNTTTFTNAVFITFLADTLAIPRMGVFAGSQSESTRPEADIDMYVARSSVIVNPGALTNLDPVVISSADKSLGRRGTEFVAYTNASPGEVYYVGIKSEDNEASEYGFIPIFSQQPFSQTDANGNETVNGLVLPTVIPDGSPSHPGTAYIFALALQPIEMQRVVVTNVIVHENFGDLFGTLTHNGKKVVLNNHDGLGNWPGIPLIYDDSGRGDIVGSQPSDGPGNLQTFLSDDGSGVWMLTEVDNSLTQTGSVTGLNFFLEKHQDPRKGINVNIQPGTWFYTFVDVPQGITNLSVFATNLPPTSVPPLQLYVRFGARPDQNNFDLRTLLTNGVPPGNSISDGPPLVPGRYFIGIFNPDIASHNVFLLATLSGPVAPFDPTLFTTNGPTLLDDAVSSSSIFIAATNPIASVNVGLVVDHPRISDLTFTLVSPAGQRVLLMENRGGVTATNAGHLNILTNFLGTTAAGDANADTNSIPVPANFGTLVIDYDFFTVPDQMDVFYDGVDIFSSGYTNGAGTFTIPFGPGVSTNILIVMNLGGNTNSLTAWTYTPRIIFADYNYLTFTENTNLTTIPIKFAIPPYDLTDLGTNYALSDFEQATNGDYFAPTNIFDAFGGWNLYTNKLVGTNVVILTNNQVSIVTDPSSAFGGSNFLALASGIMSRTNFVMPQRKYSLTYLYRGPGISGWWRGEGDATDSADPERHGQNGSLIGRFDFPAGEVGQAFQMEDAGSTFEFAGTNSYVQIRQPPSSTQVNIGTPESPSFVTVQSSALDVGTGGGFTIEGWINPTNAGFQQPLVEWLARVPTNAALTNMVIEAGPFLDRATGHYYYMLGATNWTTSEFWAMQLGGHLATVDTANEENWIFDAFAAYNGTNHNLWIGLTNIPPTFAWSSGLTSFTYTNWANGHPTNCDGTRNFTAILGPTNMQAGLWVLADDNGFVCGSPAANKIYGVVEVDEIQTNGVQFWISVTNSPGTTNSLVSSNGCLYANLVDTTNGSHEIFSAPGLIQSNIYQHVALTYNTNSGLAMLFYNGTNVATTNFGGVKFIPKTTGDVLLGKDMSRQTNNYYGGTMDEMSIYRRALSGSEIAAIYRISALTTNRNIGKFDPSVTPLEGLAEAQVSLGTMTNLVFGDNTLWKIQGFTFTPTTNMLPMQLTGLEPGTLFDSFAVTVTPVGNLYYLPEQTLDSLVDTSAHGTWTLEIWDNRTGAVVTNQLVSWQLQFVLKTNTPPPVAVIPEAATPLTVPPGGMVTLTVDVPSWASFATNILVSASSPLNLFFNQTNPPIGNAPDYQLLTNSTGGIGNPVLAANPPSTPPLIPGQRYYLGLQNPGTHAATAVVEVDFDITTLANSVPFTGFLNTNDLERYFAFNVASNAFEATFQLLNLSNNVDLVVRKGPPLPTLFSSDYGSFNAGNADENIYVLTNSSPVPLSPGVWYLGVIKRDSGGMVNYTVLAKELDTNTPPTIIDLTNGVPFDFTAGPGAALTNFFRFHATNSIVGGVTNYLQGIRFELYNLSGNGDLTVQTNAPPFAPPFFQSSRQPGIIPELIFIHTNSALTNLVADWYLGVPNDERTNINYTIIAVTDTNGYFPAFPGAAGSGGGAIGGRIGDVYHVTTNSDSGPGTLRAAVNSTNRTVVFDVAGTITLLSPLVITNSFLTIVGQTAPEGGITVAGDMTMVQSAHDVVIRNIRFRPGTGVAGDSLQFTNVSGVIADHVSASWTSNNLVSVLGSTNVTVQWSILADSLYNTNNPHGFGSLLRFGAGVLSFHHNLYADNYNASPRLGDNLSLDFVNNVIYNWGTNAGFSLDDSTNNPTGFTNQLNYVCNYLIASSNSVMTNIAFWGGSTNTWIYQTNNFIDSNTNHLLDGANTQWGMFTNKFTKFARPFPLVTVPTDEAFQAYERVLDFAGVNLTQRDSVDTNIVANVRNQTGTLISVPAVNNIVAWWKAESNYLDSVGGNNGRPINGTNFGTGNPGNGTAFQLNGTNQFVLVNVTNPVLNVGLSGGFTIEAWVNRNNVAAQKFIAVYQSGGTNAGAPFGVQFTTTAGNLAANIVDTVGGNHTVTSFSSGLITPLVWQHVALTYDKASGTATVYVNGINVGQTIVGNFTPQTSYTNFLIGARTVAGVIQNPFSGGIDEVLVYNRALSASEIAAAASGAQNTTFVSPPPYLDTDQDGIPDFWENTFTTNLVFTPSNNNDRDGDGYTDLEEYNNWLASPHALTITNTPVSVDLMQLFGKSGNLSFSVTNSVHGFVYLTNVLGSVTNTGPFSNSIAVFTPTNSLPVTTNYSGYATFDVNVTNNATIAYFGPVTVSVMVSAVPIAINSNMPPVINELVNKIPFPNTNSAGSDFYHFHVDIGAVGVLFEVTNASAPVTLVARFGLPLPSLSSYDYISANPGTADEQIVVVTNSTPVALTPGDWYLAVVNISGGPVTYAAKATEFFNVGPPEFTYPTNNTIFTNVETTLFNITCLATDTNAPPLPLTFALVSGPFGLTVSSGGVVNWTPAEDQGPSNYTVLVSVANAAFSVTNNFTIVVEESNLPPVPPNIPDQTVSAGDLLVVDDSATDPDIPANTLTYFLLTAPVGMVIDTSTGIINWTPSPADIGTHPVTVVVTDDGVPPLSATNSFNVIVEPPFTNTIVTGIPAFPGAEGAGGFAVGGRGGDIYHVTNLNDSGPGSLRNGVTASHRTIVFDVSGTINLLTDLKITRPFLTIAGQTAPGDGITTRGRLTSVQNTHDVEVRFLRFRPGDVNCPTFQDDSFHFNLASNSIADHLSASWSIDEVLSATDSTNVTVQWCMIADALNDSCHVKGLHGYGSLLRYGHGSLSFHHNLYADNFSRNPRLGDNLTLDFVNNVIYNWGELPGYSGDSADLADNPGGFTNRLNYIANYIIAGTNSVSPARAFRSGDVTTWIYQTNNLIDSNLNGILDGTDTGWGMFSGPLTQIPTPFAMPPPPVTVDTSPVAYERVLAFVGATLKRDTVDSNIVHNVRNQSGHIINSEIEVGGWPVLNSTNPPPDTDQDGIPNYWEVTLGLNPIVASNNHDRDGDGYTDLEEYLNWLAAPHAFLLHDTSVDVDLRAIVGSTDGLTFSVANGTNGTVVLLGDLHTARFTSASNYTGFASFSFDVTDTVAGISFGPVPVSVFVSLVDGNILIPSLTNGVPVTNTVPPGGIAYFAVNVPANADFATNILLFATGPVNLLFNQTNPPTGTNSGDFTLLANSTGGIGNPILGTNTVPPLIPGSIYYLGVQNTNSFTVTNAVEVDFHLLPIVPPATNIFISSITFTNIGGTNGFLLIWFAPTNDIFQVQWAPDLTPPIAWSTFSNIITYIGPPTPTNGMFSFFDDGSQTGGVLDPIRFYRLILLSATNTLILPAQTNYIATVSSLLTVTNTATDSDTSLTLTYSLTNSPATSTPATIDTNGVIAWTPGVADGGGEFKLTTIVTDNGVPPLSATNSFTVFVVPPFPAISNVTATATNVTLQWTAPTNDIFQVEWATNLTPVVVWTPFPPIITSTTGLFTFTDTNAPLFMKFYRLSWLPLP